MAAFTGEESNSSTILILKTFLMLNYFNALSLAIISVLLIQLLRVLVDNFLSLCNISIYLPKKTWQKCLKCCYTITETFFKVNPIFEVFGNDIFLPM